MATGRKPRLSQGPIPGLGLIVGGTMPHPVYKFHFAQQVLGTKDTGAKWHRVTIEAPDHLTAFQAFCRGIWLQNIPMDRLGTLKVEVSK